MADPFTRAMYNDLIGGTGVVVTKYPVNAVGVTLTGSGLTTGAYKFKAAGAGVVAIVAAAAITVPWRLVGYCLNTFSALDIAVVRLGRAAAAGAAMTQVLWELTHQMITLAGIEPTMAIPWGAVATVAVDANNGCMGDLANASAADITAVCSVSIATLMGT